MVTSDIWCLRPCSDRQTERKTLQISVGCAEGERLSGRCSNQSDLAGYAGRSKIGWLHRSLGLFAVRRRRGGVLVTFGGAHRRTSALCPSRSYGPRRFVPPLSPPILVICLVKCIKRYFAVIYDFTIITS